MVLSRKRITVTQGHIAGTVAVGFVSVVMSVVSSLTASTPDGTTVFIGICAGVSATSASALAANSRAERGLRSGFLARQSITSLTNLGSIPSGKAGGTSFI